MTETHGKYSPMLNECMRGKTTNPRQTNTNSVVHERNKIVKEICWALIWLWLCVQPNTLIKKRRSHMNVTNWIELSGPWFFFSRFGRLFRSFLRNNNINVLPMIWPFGLWLKNDDHFCFVVALPVSICWDAHFELLFGFLCVPSISSTQYSW